MPWTQGEFNVPNNFVAQYNAGQKKIRADLMDENFNDVAGAINKVVTDYTAADAGIESTVMASVQSVLPVAATEAPAAPGTAAVGTSTKYAREDHVHPSQGVPIGSVVYFSASSAPDGYIVCNGGAYSSTTYADLYAVIGTTFGGTTSSFKVPNLIDKVAWGNATVGTSKSAGLPNITGQVSPFSNFANTTAGHQCFPSGAFTATQDGEKKYYGTSSESEAAWKCAFGLDASRSNSIYGASTTVQPPALTLLPCIKY